MSDVLRELRPSVLAFAQAMERKLRKNDHRGGWAQSSPKWLLSRLREETRELSDALNGADLEVLDEAADVGNFAMMIHDVVSARRGKGKP